MTQPSWHRRWSLRARLLAVAISLLVVALVLTGAATLTVLRGVLVDEVDSRLLTVAQDQQLVEALVEDASGAPAPGVPTDYVIRVNDAEGGLVFIRVGPTLDSGSVPALDGLTLSEAERRGGRPFTARGETDRWRVVAQPVNVETPQGIARGSVAIALPLDGVDDTVRSLRTRFVLIGLVVVAACAVIGHLAVRRAFRPLRQVEAVASAFGAGDTSRRVDDDWPGTEVGRLGASVNAMLERIESTLVAREASESRMRRFVADASHELRTPLAAVRGFAELYRQGAVRRPDEVARTFDRIEGESRRMGGLVEDLLLLARLDEQRPMRFEDVDLVVLAADATHDAHALAPDRTVRLTGLDGAAAPGAARTRGDDSRLRQVLSNLIANAVRHTPAGTPIEVGVGTRGDWALWQVADHGPGIGAEHATRVFERFFRSDSSRQRASGGSGLGLAIVAAVAHAHGGAARVIETPGGGATFEVALPSVGGDVELPGGSQAGRSGGSDPPRSVGA